MNERGERRVRVLCVGVDTDVGDDFDVRHVETAAAARTAVERDASTSWFPNCVVSGTLTGAGGGVESDVDGLGLLRWVDECTHRVATVLAPGAAGSERLASRAVAAGVTGYYPAGDSLAETVRTALERVRRDGEGDQGVDRRYRTLAENLPNGAVALYDRDLRYLVVEGTAFDALPVDRVHLEGERFGDAHSPAYVERYGSLYRAALDGERSEFEFTYAGRTYRGHTVPVRDRTGAVVAGMALTQDVTDAREQRARLERQNERLDRFASIVSHDLRTPLNVVDGSLVLLREAVADGDQTAVDENLDRISRACRRMNHIVENVLTLARQPDRIDDTGDIPLAETVRSVWSHLDTEGTVLVVDVDGRETTTVRADGHALRRLLENLFANAVTHGSADGDTVTVRVEWIDEDDACGPGFAVSDDGPGLSREAREHAFDWGYTTEGSGVGFGLGIVQRIAEAHGWTVSVTQSTAGGARFEVRGVDCATRPPDVAAEPERCE
ncbi:ATP-binding protein [Salinigranum sp.]|uniref:sensor histidine kinase n=1 Tax=Salinigranum sp. TaxID=1966351 RepID=UPI003566D0CF